MRTTTKEPANRWVNIRENPDGSLIACDGCMHVRQGPPGVGGFGDARPCDCPREDRAPRLGAGIAYHAGRDAQTKADALHALACLAEREGQMKAAIALADWADALAPFTPLDIPAKGGPR